MDLTIRTPAGASNVFAVAPDPRHTTGQLTERVVAYFVAHDQLEPGPFRLGLIRGRTIIDLIPEAPLLDEGVIDGDVLHLITCEPQVDGMALHPAHRGDPWDKHRARLRLADVVTHILRRCRQ